MTRLPVPSWRDLALGAVLTVVAEVELLLSTARVEGSVPLHVTSTLLILPAIALRGVAPLAAISVAAVSLAAQPLMGPAPVATPYLCLLFLLACLGWYAGLRVGLVGVALTLLAGLAPDLGSSTFLLADLVVNAALIVLAWGAGRTVRVATDRRVHAELSADRAAREAVALERERIGRELHDSMAHALTLITLQAGSARERTERGLAADTLAAIERTGREALADMHRLLSLIGPGDGETPGLGHLPDLVDQVRRGGLLVDLNVEVSADDIPTSVSATLYRVVQEGLTNVVRHSAAARAHVLVSTGTDGLVARVTDDGKPVPARTPGSGRGLTGLRDRLALFNGHLESGATTEGWRLEARIPLTEVSR